MQIPLLHPTLSVLLLPVLMYQGQKVRDEVPRLPEAEGPREGSSASGGNMPGDSMPGGDMPGGKQQSPLRILILGDSAAAGVGVEQQEQALAGQLLSHLPADLPVSWRLLARNGLKLRDIAKLLDEDEDTYDIAIISAGVNDATSRTRRYQFLCELQALSERLKRRHGVQRILYTAVPPMQVFPALPQPLRWYLGQRAKRLNSILRAHCDTCDIAQMMVVDFPYTGDYMADDGFHPSAAGYRLWGGRAAALIKEWQAGSVV